MLVNGTSFRLSSLPCRIGYGIGMLVLVVRLRQVLLLRFLVLRLRQLLPRSLFSSLVTSF